MTSRELDFQGREQQQLQGREQQKMHACCVDARPALAAFALLLLLVLALLLLSLLLLSLHLLRLQCSTLSPRTRFPFHDSQVNFRTPEIEHAVGER